MLMEGTMNIFIEDEMDLLVVKNNHISHTSVKSKIIKKHIYIDV